jgi:DNA polymerase
VKEPRDELLALSRALRSHLNDAGRRGTERVPFAAPATTATAAAPATTALTAAPRPSPDAGRGKKLALIPVEPETSDYGERIQRLAALAATVSGCTRCGLSRTRTQTVFARGRARNRVMFIGEAPGADEDAQGFPFVGRAGQLLDQILDAAGFDRDEVYVANILKCRPPNNRDPQPDEVAACTPFLEAQIEAADPRIICALGRHAAQFLTGKPGAPMGQLRGRIHYYRDRIPVLPTYHPAALLRNPEWKRVVWEDVQLLRREYLGG